MFSWVAGLNYDYRTSNDKFLNSFNVKYYYYSMKTRMASVLVKTAEDIDTHKNDFGISNALRYRITPSLMAKASFGYDVRLPSEEELLGDGYVIAPAGNLTPERNISVNIGMLFDLTGKASSNLQIELNGYYMHLKDMIRFTGGFLQSQYQNFGEMRTLGMEAEVKADMTRWLYGYVNATYQDLRDVRKYEQNTIVANPTKDSPYAQYTLSDGKRRIGVSQRKSVRRQRDEYAHIHRCFICGRISVRLRTKPIPAASHTSSPLVQYRL